MNKWYHNGMAIVREYGKPGLFITMTCNPRWPEIKNALFAGQTANDRPDLISRVFKMKLTALMKDLKSGVLGEVQAWMNVVEFQKRGLPHAHILLIFKQGSKLRTPDAYDSVVSAEIPDKTTQPKLHDVVMRNMIHTCRTSCLANGSCSSHYPQNFTQITYTNSEGYPEYRRRQPNAGKWRAEYKRQGTKQIINNRYVFLFLFFNLFSLSLIFLLTSFSSRFRKSSNVVQPQMSLHFTSTSFLDLKEPI